MFKGKKINNRIKQLSAYIAGAALSFFILFKIAGASTLDISKPLSFYGDDILGLYIYKIAISTSWLPFLLLKSPSAGAPFGFHTADFPVTDHFHLFIMKILALFTADTVTVLNLFYFSTFILSTLTFIFCLRQFRVGYLISICFGLLFAFLPYHFIRFSHLFLASYFHLPLLATTLLWLWSKNPLFAKIKSYKSVMSLIIVFIAGISGLYYAFFFAMFAVIAGISAAVYRKNIGHFFSSLILVSVLASSLLLSYLPSKLYALKYGANPEVTTRPAYDAEKYGLKLMHVLVPIYNHRSSWIGSLKSKYISTTEFTEGSAEYLGFISILGFFILLFRFFLIGKKNSVLDKLTVLNISAFLIGTIGALGTLFAYIISPQIRCYNRISVFIALFSLMGFAFFLQSLKNKIGTKLVNILTLVIFTIGIYDQVPRWLKDAGKPYLTNYNDHKEFIERIEKLQNGHGTILQLPFMAFPESPTIINMTDYNHFIGPLFASSLSWSYGTSKGRAESKSIAEISQSPLRLDEIKKMGYNGIYIDRNGFADHGIAIENELVTKIGHAPIVSQDNRLSFFTL